MLSKENRAKINLNGLYFHEPTCKMRRRLFWNDLYHCMNWTFWVKERKGGRLFMEDTYWSTTESENVYEITDDNIDEWELIFDKTEVRKVTSQEAEIYEETDKFHVAVDSGGMYCGGKWFVKMDAKPSKQLRIEKLMCEIDLLEHNLKNAKKELEKIEAEE